MVATELAEIHRATERISGGGQREAQRARGRWVSGRPLPHHLEACEAGFGYLTDEADEAGYRTALEDALGLFPEDMLADLDRQIRGYSWITVVSPGVAEVVGGAEALSTSQAFP